MNDREVNPTKIIHFGKVTSDNLLLVPVPVLAKPVYVLIKIDSISLVRTDSSSG